MEKKKILVVDDNEDIRSLLGEILNNLFPDKEIFCLTNGAEAWEEIQDDPYSIWLIITDWQMPQMDGVALTKKVKFSFPGIPVILSSANELPADNPADAFLAKPFQIQKLLELVQKLIYD